MSAFKSRAGEKHITNEGYEVEIIKYFGWDNCTIQFEDGVIIENIKYHHIKKGEVKNPHHKSVYGVGFFGQGKYKATAQYRRTEQYNRWYSMFERCYDDNYQKKRPTYKEAIVCEEWHNFQDFAEWYDENHVEGWCLDKDILIKENKTYSSETCCFVPNEINNLFTKSNSSRGKYPIGVSKTRRKYKTRLSKNDKNVNLGHYNTPEEAFEVYKTEKEKYIKEVAEKYKNKIAEKVYQTLINYQVEITD